MKVKVRIYKGFTDYGKELRGQLLVVGTTAIIIPDKSLSFDGHHIYQDYDSALWVQPDSIEFLFEKDVEAR